MMYCMMKICLFAGWSSTVGEDYVNVNGGIILVVDTLYDNNSYYY
jgi:hypothetical protein